MFTTVIAVVAATGSLLAQALPPVDEVVLTVNGEPLYAGELQLTAQTMAKHMAAEKIEPEAEQLLDAAVAQAIDHKLLAQEARRLGVEPSPRLIDNLLNHYRSEAGGQEALEKDLAARGSSLQSLRAHVAEAAAVNLLFERTIRPTVTITDEEVGAYYAENRDSLFSPAEVRARHIVIGVAPDASDEERAAARRQAEEARKRALAGEDFAALAAELSQGPTAVNGGDIGFMPRERMYPEFAEAAFSLDIGEISEVVETERGFHVIKVEERREAGIPELKDVKEQLRELLFEERVKVKINDLLKALRAEAEIVPGGEEAENPE